jgi:hypothetical protein
MIQTEPYSFDMGYKISKDLAQNNASRVKQLMTLFNEHLKKENDLDRERAKFLYANGYKEGN